MAQKPRPPDSQGSTLIFQAPRVALVDERGLITREWYRFFEVLFYRVGGISASTPQEIISDTEQILGDDIGVEELRATFATELQSINLAQIHSLREEVAELTKAVQALQQGTQP